MRNYNEIVARVLFDAERTDGELLQAVVALCEEVYEDGYDQAAAEITLKLQDLIPSKAKTVPDARVQGAWRDAANVALNHLGKLSRTGE